jgi:hypothetical protein
VQVGVRNFKDGWPLLAKHPHFTNYRVVSEIWFRKLGPLELVEHGLAPMREQRQIIFIRAGGYLTLFGVIGANMGCKLFVTLQLEVAHHVIERCAGGSISRFKTPATFGATKTPKKRLLNPYQLSAHGRLCRCASQHPLPIIGTKRFGSP